MTVATEEHDIVLRLDLRSKTFGATHILKDVSFALSRGETLVLRGPSGVGKSTILRLISGLDTEFDGNIQLQDKLSIAFQEPTLLPWCNVVENLTIIEGVDEKMTLEALASVGLREKVNAFPNDLSLGQQRRLALARAFVIKPDVLLMDEPFVSLDDRLSDDVIGVYEKLRSETGVSTLLVTHNEREAARLGDRILTLAGQPATLV